MPRPAPQTMAPKKGGKQKASVGKKPEEPRLRGKRRKKINDDSDSPDRRRGEPLRAHSRATHRRHTQIHAHANHNCRPNPENPEEYQMLVYSGDARTENWRDKSYMEVDTVRGRRFSREELLKLPKRAAEGEQAVQPRASRKSHNRRKMGCDRVVSPADATAHRSPLSCRPRRFPL